MDILFLEPFYSGSHEYFAKGIVNNSSFNIDLLTLPGRFWKWRMRGAALEFSRMSNQNKKYDLIVTGNLMDLCQWKALNRNLQTPVLLYVHENQLAYPIKKGEVRDFQYGWTDYTNMLCADRILFNSAYNRDSFYSELDKLITKMPDCKPDKDFTPLLSKTSVIPPGCKTAETWDESLKCEQNKQTPLIIWNHRWEHDKNPEDFFRILRILKDRGLSFRLALLGESYSVSPECFARSRMEFRKELVHFGYAETREEYEEWLKKADFVISTSRQENFGISIVEAASYGAIPILPHRLAYPEVLPEEFHKDLLFKDLTEAGDCFSLLINNPDLEDIRKKLSASMKKYSWEVLIKQFDKVFWETANHGK